jgi:hypothetical protein
MRPSFFDVDVDQLAGPGAFVADGLLEPEPAEFTIPIRVRIPATVESGISSVSAISAAVIRNRRSFTITATRSVSVRFATRCAPKSDQRGRLRRPPCID